MAPKTSGRYAQPSTLGWIARCARAPVNLQLLVIVMKSSASMALGVECLRHVMCAPEQVSTQAAEILNVRMVSVLSLALIVITPTSRAVRPRRWLPGGLSGIARPEALPGCSRRQLLTTFSLPNRPSSLPTYMLRNLWHQTVYKFILVEGLTCAYSFPHNLNMTNVNSNTMYPEINGMNVRDVRLALRMGYNMFDSVKPEAQVELKARLEQMEDRLRRLNATERRIVATRKAH